jgi:predicted PhzF superfamily epimerase YddE/YHI9
VIGPSNAEGVDWEVRAFFTKSGGVLAEDPVTGSLNAGAALYLYGAGLASGDYVAAQGRCVGADGRVYVSRDEEGVWIGGAVRMVAGGGVLAG